MREWCRHAGASLATAAVLLLAACTTPRFVDRVPSLPQDQHCGMADDDRRWLGQVPAGWQVVVRDFLKAHERQLPQIITYDSRCSYTLAAPSGSPAQWSVAEHGGEITLPNGAKIPPAPTALNAATEGRNFVVMSLPSIWRPIAPKSEIPLEWFLEGVLFHELAHAYQSVVTPELSFPYLHREHRLPESVNDDSVQEAFRTNAAYVREYEAERDLLFRAASAPTDVEARTLTCDALAKLRSRRARQFTGSNSKWALIDEVSLTTEGLGEWVSYTWLTQARGLAPSLVLSKFRKSVWSQEQGVAIFLTVDRLVSNWQRRLFSRSPASAEQLLALACGR